MRAQNTIRLVPTERDPYDETVALIERHGWTQSENYGDDLIEWKVPGSDTLVRWVVDAVTQVQFFVVEGPDRQRVAEQIEDTIEVLKVDDFEGYLAGIHGTQGLIQGLYTVATATPDRADDRVVRLFERCLGSDDSLIREATLVAISIIGWPEFAASVGRLRDDPDPDVREAAKGTLEELR